MSILVFGDEQDFHSAVAKSSEKFNASVEHAESSDVAGDFFDAIKPELVVFCFDGVDKAEVGLKALYAHSEIAAFTDFTTLLLCTKNETETALNLCLKGVFNDYIIAKPLQDGAQLKWRIQSLLSAYQTKPKTVIHNILSQLSEMQTRLANSGAEATSPNSRINTLNRQKLSRAHDGLRAALHQHLLPLISSQAGEVNHEQNQSVIKQQISSLVGDYSGTIDDIIHSLIKSLVEQYQSVDNSLDSALKVAKSAVKPTIMVVDDNSGFREPVTQMLLDEGYRVIASDAGTKAVGMIIREGPDLVLMDYQMPAMDGLETIKQVKELLNGAKTPFFIMITGHSSEDVVQEARGVGVDGFLVKPLRKADLLEKVNAKLGNNRVKS